MLFRLHTPRHMAQYCRTLCANILQTRKSGVSQEKLASSLFYFCLGTRCALVVACGALHPLVRAWSNFHRLVVTAGIAIAAAVA